jgi:hypothetical protein
MGNCSSTSNCNPCGPNYDAINQLATKTASYARQANTYAVNAENSATNAENSATNAENYWKEFNALYLGSFASAPTVDNEGNPLQEGALYFNSVSNQMFVWQGASWIDFDFDEFTPFLATGTTFARNLVTRTEDVINVKDFGAVGNGVANDRTAFTNAMNAASTTKKKLYIPAGNYNLDTPLGGTCFVPQPDVTIVGDGQVNTKLIFQNGGTCFFVQHPNLSISNLSIETIVPSGGTSFIFLISNSNFSVTDCVIDGKVTNSGSLVSHTSNCFFHMPNGTQNNLTVQNCVLTRHTWPFLKDNAATSTQKNIRILSNKFITNYTNDCGLNSPNGVMEDVIIDGNTFEDNRCNITGGPTQALGIALASVSNVVISNNIIKGQYTDAIHIEEESHYVKIIGNNVSITKGLLNSKCIAFNANSVGGTMIKPQHIVVSSNNFYQYGPSKEVGTFGIAFIYNSLFSEPADDIIVANNTFYDFGTGIYSAATLNDSISINDNIIEQCGEGLNVNDGALTVYNNTTKACDFGITCNTSTRTNEAAVIKEHIFINCNANVFVTNANNIVLINPKFIFSEFNHAPTTTLKTLLPARSQDRIYGQLTMTIISGIGFTTGSAFDIEVITWDGTNLTWNDTSSLTPSPTPVSRVNFENGFSLNASRTGTTLDVAVTNVTARDECRLQVDLTGAAMIRI